MYQAGPESRSPSGDAAQVVLVIDVAGPHSDELQRTMDLLDEFGQMLTHLVPGVRVRAATVSAAAPVERAVTTGVRIDRTRRLLLVDGRPVRLAYREFELLDYLARQRGRTVSRTELLREVWRDRPPGAPEEVSERTVDTHIRRLRTKLGGFANVVTTVRGRGYRFDADTPMRAGSDDLPIASLANGA